MWLVFEIESDEYLSKKLAYYPFIIWKPISHSADTEIVRAARLYSCKVKAVWKCEDANDALEWIAYIRSLRNENK